MSIRISEKDARSENFGKIYYELLEFVTDGLRKYHNSLKKEKEYREDVEDAKSFYDVHIDEDGFNRDDSETSRRRVFRKAYESGKEDSRYETLEKIFKMMTGIDYKYRG